MQLHQWLSVLLLAALLFVPVSRIILAFSLRRLARRGVATTEANIAGQRNRARVITVPLVLLFAYLFYVNVVRPLYGYG